MTEHYLAAIRIDLLMIACTLAWIAVMSHYIMREIRMIRKIQEGFLNVEIVDPKKN